MEKKITIEELEKQCLEAEQNFKTLHEQLTKARKDEEETRQAKLKAEKDARYKEVIDAYDKFEKLRSKYIDDYGSFTFKTTSSLPYWWNMFSIYCSKSCSRQLLIFEW